MELPEDVPAALDERRDHPRVPVEGRILIELGRTAFGGKSQNVSRSGLLFFTQDELPVSVEMEEDGVVKKLEGVLVRLQRLASDRTGWAIEFRS